MGMKSFLNTLNAQVSTECNQYTIVSTITRSVNIHTISSLLQIAGVHTLQAESTRVSLACLEGLGRDAAPSTSPKCWTDSCILLAQQTELALLPRVCTAFLRWPLALFLRDC